MDNERFQELVLKKLESLDTLTTDVAGFKNDVSDLRNRQNELQQSQIRMENNLTEKIRGLYDFREVQNDVNSRIIATLERIETKVDVLQMETASMRRIK